MNWRLYLPFGGIIALVLMAGFVYSKNRSNPLNKKFTFFAILLATWNMQDILYFSSLTSNILLYAYRLFFVGGLISLKYYLEFNWALSKKMVIPQNIKKIINISMVSLSVLMLTPLIIKNVSFNPYLVEEPGALYILFIVYLLGVLGYTFYGFRKGFKIAEGGEKQQYYVLIYSFTFMITAGLLYIAWLINPQMFPYYYIFEVLYCAGIAYAIIQYRLMDIRTIIHKTIMWAISSAAIIIPIYLLIRFTHDRFMVSPFSVKTLGIVLLLLCYSFYLKYLQPKIDHFFDRKKYDLQAVIKKFTEELIILKGLEKLADKIIQTITNALYIDKSSLLLFDGYTGNFRDYKKIGIQKEISIPGDDFFLAWLKKNSQICEINQVELDPHYQEIREKAKDYLAMVEAKVCVPLVYNQELIGILNLNEKKNLKSYTNLDLEFLIKIKNEATIAISNSLLLDKVEKQNLDLKKINKLKSEMLANTSHELKTPINQIKGVAEQLIEELEKKENGDKEVISDLKLIVESGEELNKKVNDILDASKLAAGQKMYCFNFFDLKGLVDILLIYSRKNMERSNKKELILSADIPQDLSYVYGDQKAINTVLDNLIRNAIKFTEKGEIKISAKIIGQTELKDSLPLRGKSDKYTLISVSDTGIGIKKEDQGIIFDQFRQADSSFSRGYGGTGLGLYICKNIIEGHFGSLWVESDWGKGAAFYFILPFEHKDVDKRIGMDRRRENERRRESPLNLTDLRNASSPAKMTGNELEVTEEYKTVARGNGQTILVVDDDSTNVLFVRKMLEGHGYKVLSAYGGEEALDILYKNYADKKNAFYNGRIELVILDLMMPGFTGYDFCKEIRQQFKFQGLPVIMLTVMDENKYYVYSYNLGADDYLTKPFDRDKLLAKVGLLLKNTHTRHTVDSIMEVGKVLVSQYELKELIELSVIEIKRLMSAEKVSIMLMEEDKEGKYLKIENMNCIEDAQLKQEKIRYGERIAGYVWKTDAPMLIKNISEDERFKNNQNRGCYKTKSFIASPITYRKEFLGVICACDKQNVSEFNIDDLNYLVILSDQIAVAINKIADLKKIEQKRNLEFMAETVDWVGHEVNTPAQAIMANADLLLEYDLQTLSPEKYKKYLKNIAHSCKRIRSICEIIRNYGEKGIKVETLKIRDLIDRILNYSKVNLLEERNEIRVIDEFSGNGEMEIYGDLGMLELTLLNMIKNSSRSILLRKKKENFEGRIKLVVFSEGENVCLQVEDNGAGIEKQEINNIFNRNFSTNPDGRGIGLFLAKKVITDHHGTIEVDSEINNFTRLTIKLPLLK